MGTNPPTPQGGSASLRSFRDLDAEARMLAGDAYDLWRSLAAERANPYGDHAGCLLAGRMAVNAMRWEDGFVILDAIRQRMDEKSSPRWIPEWARTLGSMKREEIHMRAKREQQAQLDDIDPEVQRVMVAIARAKSQGKRVNLADHFCLVCKQFTEGKCPTCSRPVHQRACRLKHECGVAA